jgi:hypothetical protein
MRCARAVKAEWKSADDLLNFWSTDYGDDAALKQLLMKKLDPKKMLANGLLKLIFLFRRKDTGIHQIHYRVSPTTPLGKMKKIIAEKVNKPFPVFFFKGHQIWDDETPMSLQMKNDDTIYVVF